ncbi:hypothetical protein [Bacillus wiedmannii]|uniref:hypothetical protein n=1 Tax=Bacillus wiedmannii TaxID=1890302 RepID=UPI001F6138F3|nr:hypothetical protein [Bacillus wiedmannii]
MIRFVSIVASGRYANVKIESSYLIQPNKRVTCHSCGSVVDPYDAIVDVSI